MLGPQDAAQLRKRSSASEDGQSEVTVRGAMPHPVLGLAACLFLQVPGGEKRDPLLQDHKESFQRWSWWAVAVAQAEPPLRASENTLPPS